MTVAPAAPRARRRFHHCEFPLPRLLQAKGRQRVSVCIPAHDEESTVGAAVASAASLRDAGVVDEIIVVDDVSTDGSAGGHRGGRPRGTAGRGTGERAGNGRR